MRRLAPLALVLILGAGCATQVGQDKVGIHYTQGPIEGDHCENIVEPGHGETVIDDIIVMIPANLRSYIVSNDENVGDRAGGDALVFPTKGTENEPRGPEVSVELEARFFVNTRSKGVACAFYLDVCKKYDCDTDSGWDKMLDENFRVPMQTVVNEIGPQFDAEKLQVDPATKDRFADQFGEEFASNLKRLLGRDDFFCGSGYRRSVDDEKNPHYCPPVSLNLTSVRYTSEDLRGIPDQRRLAEEQVDLAEQQRAAAQAQQSVLEKQVTPQYVEDKRLDAMLACARNENPGACVLVMTSGDGGAAPNVSVTPQTSGGGG